MARVLAAIGKKSNIALAALFLATAPAKAHPSLSPLTSSEIAATLFGTRVTGEYASGLGWAERFNSDFTSDYVENGVVSRGRMRFEGDHLCFDYGKQELNGGCFEVWQRGANCFDFYAVNSAGPPASLTQKRFGRGWDARAWKDGLANSCQTDQIS